jgi:hypothetical protein
MPGVALIYVRRSMVRYEEDRASPERQLANCVAVCDQKGWAYEVYEDAVRWLMFVIRLGLAARFVLENVFGWCPRRCGSTAVCAHTMVAGVVELLLQEPRQGMRLAGGR